MSKNFAVNPSFSRSRAVWRMLLGAAMLNVFDGAPKVMLHCAASSLTEAKGMWPLPSNLRHRCWLDMIETAENVWSDSCVAAMTDHDL